MSAAVDRCSLPVTQNHEITKISKITKPNHVFVIFVFFVSSRLVQHFVDEAIRSGQESVVVDWLSGACMLARRDTLEAVKGFDERFFLYWEDADLCRRLRARGDHVRFVPGATAIHRVGQSSRTARSFAIRAFHESAYLYYATHVAPAPLNPKRAVARAILYTRCRMQLIAASFRVQ